ncbi:MAG: hypothetical protein ACUVX9_11290 [Anaerolineae bacterium]
MSSDSKGSAPLGVSGAGARPSKADLAPRRPGLFSRLVAVYDAHPGLITWLVLAVGMVLILLWATRDVELLTGQRLALAVATVVLAGLCAWIVGWESGDEDEAG